MYAQILTDFFIFFIWLSSEMKGGIKFGFKLSKYGVPISTYFSAKNILIDFTANYVLMSGLLIQISKANFACLKDGQLCFHYQFLGVHK